MTQPSPLWYATRGAGTVALILLTASVVLGIVTSVGWKSDDWPRFVLTALHRNLSLFVIAFGVVHVLTAIFDPTVSLGIKAAVVPFGSNYRTLWLSLGVISSELLVGIIATSLLRQHLGYLAWRAIHWLTYATWPLAILHSLGTGTDSHSGWFVLVAAGCTISVLAALFWRANQGLMDHPSLRVLSQGTCGLAALALVIWTAAGPLQPGWARRAGTPSSLLAGSGTTPAAALAPGMDDQLQGSLRQADNGSLELSLQDVQQPALQLIIDVPDPRAQQASLTVTQNGASLCQAPAAIANAVTASCGQTQLTITLRRAGRESGGILGELITGAASA
ncbi:MAG TPA: ferric reductase-like transmembrane domain-containing protein [Chloroflexota bacterium]|nr:ferric reductase-like transmembrane domain-containing protein [Chloroflexota bacterium]